MGNTAQTGPMQAPCRLCVNNLLLLFLFSQGSPHNYATHRASLSVEICELSKRAIIGLWRNPLLVAAHWGTVAVVAMLMVTLYSKTKEEEEEGGAPGVHNRLGALFFVVAFLALASLSGLDLFLRERPPFIRERAAKMYRASSYFMVKVWWDLLLLRVLPALALGGSTYHLAGLREGTSHFLVYLIIVTLLRFNVSACVPFVWRPVR